MIEEKKKIKEIPRFYDINNDIRISLSRLKPCSGGGGGDEYAENSRNAAIPGIVSRGKPIGFHLFLIKFETRAPLLSARREDDG